MDRERPGQAIVGVLPVTGVDQVSQLVLEDRETGVDVDRLYAQLLETFGYNEFRPLQLDIIQAILSGRDVFVLMPTGGGKSLCFQLPALMIDGLTVVVSPLIALMKDQVDSLDALGVSATFINSSLSPKEIRRREAAIREGQVRLLYVAPERLMTDSFLGLHAERPPMI
jgi:ATP-dependent DNA helicase RecQ